MAYMRLLKKPWRGPGRPRPSHSPKYILSFFAHVICQLSPWPPSRKTVSSSRRSDLIGGFTFGADGVGPASSAAASRKKPVWKQAAIAEPEKARRLMRSDD